MIQVEENSSTLHNKTDESVQIVVGRDAKKAYYKGIIVFVVLIVISGLAFIAIKNRKPQNLLQSPRVITVASSNVATVASSTLATLKELTPLKKNFGQKVPDNFPSSIPIPDSVSFSQSYIRDYSNASSSQKQFTVVFYSTKIIKQNYDLYAEFLKKDGWTVVNKYESTTISSLYGIKGNNDINITISTGTSTKSQVSISLLKK